MSHQITRRDFLKIGAAAAAASVVSGCTPALQQTEYLESYVMPPEEELPGENLWYATTCRQCAAGCGMIVRVSNGRARKAEGNPLHPLNQGKLCARGQAALQELYDPDRLRRPMRQIGGRGSGQFEPITWEAGLDSALGRLQTTSADGVAFVGGSMSSSLWTLTTRFMTALGAPAPVIYDLGDELDGRAALLHVSEQLYGEPALPLYDLGQTDILFSFGANFLENWLSPVRMARDFSQMRRRPLGTRGYIVHFSPRYSPTAVCADEWVPIQPGSEGHVALALGKIISDGGLAPATSRAGQYAGVSLEAASRASGVSIEELERLARIFAAGPASLAMAGNLPAGHAHGAEALTAIQSLNALMERLGQPGGLYLAARPDGTDFQSPPASRFGDMQSLLTDMAAGRVQILFVHGSNPLFSLPSLCECGDALANVPFIVSFASAMDETSALADVILPDHTNLESWGYHAPALADRPIVSGMQPVVRPLYETRATGDVWLALAQMLGGAMAEALPWRNEVEFLSATIPYWRSADQSATAFWADWRRRGGWWAGEPALRAPEARTSGATLQMPAKRPADDANIYPYQLHVYPSNGLFDGRGANKSWLQELPDPMTTMTWQTWVELNPHTADALGVHDGDVVRVASRAGEITAPVYVYHGIAEDVVAIPLGQGHQQYGRLAEGRGANAVKILTPAFSEESGALAWGDTRVRITPTGETVMLARLENPEGIEYLRGGTEH
jgi:anaerobic selenocysteine-containing dehydrogenase